MDSQQLSLHGSEEEWKREESPTDGKIQLRLKASFSNVRFSPAENTYEEFSLKMADRM